MKPWLIVVGTGRDGTASMHHFISQLFENESKGRQACHEYASRDCYNALDAYWRTKEKNGGEGNRSELANLYRLLSSCPYDAIIGNGYAFAFTELSNLFPKDAYFIHLKRHDREACINSWIKCSELFPEANGNYAAINNIEYQVWRTAAFHLNEMTNEKWETLPIREKFEWYYDRTHSLIEEMSKHFSRRMRVYTEELSDPTKLAEIAGFLSIPLRDKPRPVHRNAFIYADVTQIDSFFTPKAQWLYSNFDFSASVKNELSAIDYFCERFISWNSYLISDQDKGELARYLQSEETMLSNVQRGRSLLAHWEKIFGQLETTLKDRKKRKK